MLRRKTIHSLSCLATGLLLALAGCVKPEAPSPGSARFSVSLHQSLSSQDVARVIVTLSASDIPERSADLTPVEGHWAGSLADIPPGADRTFSAVALDASGNPRFAGQVSGVTIVADEMAAVSLVLQQLGEAPALDNAVPGIQALLSSVDRIPAGGTVSLEVRAYDPDPADALSYAWSAPAGAFASPSSASTSWTAPQQAGPVTLTVTVTDSHGALTSHSLTLQVGNFPPVIAATSQQPLQSWGGLYLYVAAWDPHGTFLQFSWSTNYGRVGMAMNGRTNSENSWMPPQCLPPGAVPVVTVTVRNERGLSTTTSFTIPDPITPCAPTGWTPALSMAAARHHHTATLLPSGQVLAAGGFTSSYGSGSAELFDPTTRSWSLAAEMLVRRERHTATPVLDKVLFAGGFTSSGTSASTELYDPATNTWTLAAPMATARSIHAAVRLNSGKVLVIGGSTSNGASATAELYDPATNTWSATGSMSTPRYGHTATVLETGKVLVVGGFNATGGASASAELYDPATGTWSSAGSTSAMRALHAAIRLRTGQVLVTGGTATYSYEGAPQLAAAELYDPATNTWRATGSLLTARSGHVMEVSRRTGHVLVAGGRDAYGSLTSAELYDLDTGTWSPTGNMGQTRHAATITLLPDGELLVAGGRLLAYAAPRGIEVSYSTEKVELYLP